MKSFTLFPRSIKRCKISNPVHICRQVLNAPKYHNERWLSSSTPIKRRNVFKVLNDDLVRDQTFEKNVKSYEKLIAINDKFKKIASSGGGEKAIERHTVKQKKMLATERLKHFLDEESDFLELSMVAGLQMEYGDIPRAGIITG